MMEDNKKEYHFIIIPKTLDLHDPFYSKTNEGCIDVAKDLSVSNNVTVKCHYVGIPHADPREQARIMKALVNTPEEYNLTRPPEGISVAVLDEQITGEAIDYVYHAGVPIVTFDSDAPKSLRQAFIGTDSYAFGKELGKLLLQLYPVGGNYAIMTGAGPNLVDRSRGVRDVLHDPINPSKWKEISYSPRNCNNNLTLSDEMMYEFAADPNLDAVVPVGGWPMFDGVSWKIFARHDHNRSSELLTVVADTTDTQILMLTQGYVNGLVGQLPYDMGAVSARELYNINQGIVPAAGEEIFNTNILQLVKMPLSLPELVVNHNHLGSLAILGYLLFALVGVLAMTISVFVFVKRRTHVIRASQPVFLYMIIIGTLILGASIIPLTVDDKNHTLRAADQACMTYPWLVSIGFCTVFAALFSKTWRIYKIMQSAQRCQRVKISVLEVLTPYVALMMVNILMLVCWTIFAPLRYHRSPHLGKDDWGRIMSTYGSCEVESNLQGGATPFYVVLLGINGLVLVAANIIAYKSRHIHTEYSESRYIGLVNASLLQTAIVGAPVVALVRDQPTASFLVQCLLIFVTCMAILTFIFYPKYHAIAHPQPDAMKGSKYGTINRKKSFTAQTFSQQTASTAGPSSWAEQGSTLSMGSGLRCDYMDPSMEIVAARLSRKRRGSTTTRDAQGSVSRLSGEEAPSSFFESSTVFMAERKTPANADNNNGEKSPGGNVGRRHVDFAPPSPPPPPPPPEQPKAQGATPAGLQSQLDALKRLLANMPQSVKDQELSNLSESDRMLLTPLLGNNHEGAKAALPLRNDSTDERERDQQQEQPNKPSSFGGGTSDCDVRTPETNKSGDDPEKEEDGAVSTDHGVDISAASAPANDNHNNLADIHQQRQRDDGDDVVHGNNNSTSGSNNKDNNNANNNNYEAVGIAITSDLHAETEDHGASGTFIVFDDDDEKPITHESFV